MCSGDVNEVSGCCQTRLFALQFSYNPQFADWTKETRGVPLIHSVPMDTWLLIYTRRNYDVANTLVQSLFEVTPSMGIHMNTPSM